MEYSMLHVILFLDLLNSCSLVVIISVTQQPNSDLDVLIVEVSNTHS